MAESVLDQNKKNKTQGNSMMNKEAPKWIGVPVAILVIVAFGCAVSSLFSGNNSGSKDSEDTNSEQNTSEVTMADVDDVCFEAMLAKVSSRNVDVISLSVDKNANMTSFDYDRYGNPYYLYTWNGKNGNNKAHFSCFVVAKDKGNIQVVELDMDGERLQGDIIERGVYNKKGEKQE